MASYEAADYIGEAIESALGQTYPRVEVIVADDCSGDGTADVAEDYERRYPDRVKVLRGERNLGSWRNRDRALQASRGELLTRLDGDDVWMPEKVAMQVELLRDRPRAGLAYTGFELFDSNTGERIGEPVGATVQGDAFERFWSDGNFVNSLTAMWRREAMARRDACANPHLVYMRLLRNFAGDYPEVRPRLGPIVRRRLASERRLAAAHERRHGRRVRGAALWCGGFVRDPAALLRRPGLRLLTAARVATRPIQPSYRRERRRSRPG